MLEKQNNIKPGQLSSFLSSKGLSAPSVFTRIKAQIVWSKLIQRRLLPQITISDDEISDVLDRLKEKKLQV